MKTFPEYFFVKTRENIKGQVLQLSKKERLKKVHVDDKKVKKHQFWSKNVSRFFEFLVAYLHVFPSTPKKYACDLRIMKVMKVGTCYNRVHVVKRSTPQTVTVPKERSGLIISLYSLLCSCSQSVWKSLQQISSKRGKGT